MKKRILSASAALVLVAATGCATIMNGSRQNISVNSNPSGATVFVDGQQVGITPASLNLARKQSHVVRIVLDGYQPYEMAMTRGTSGWVWGNLAFGGLIGLVVDASTGSLYKLSPEQITGQLLTRQARVDGRTILQVAVTLNADPSWQKIGQLQAE
jgi:hypothetical protein